MNKKYKKTEFVIPTKSEYLAVIRDGVKDFITEIVTEKKLMMQIVLTIDEAVANIMEHSHKWNEKLSIKLEAYLEDNKLTLKMYDKGTHEFDPEKAGKVDLEEHFKKRKTGGLGWYIIKNSMDEVKYEHLPEEGNLLTLVKYL